MNGNEQNFESLRRLLALKRYEMPPPGYFNTFSHQVRGRIRAGETERSAGLAERLGLSSLLKWFKNLEATQAYAASFATVLCLLLVFGAVMAQRPEGASQAFLQPAGQPPASLPMVAATAPMTTPVALGQSPTQIMIGENSTNPVVNFQNNYQNPPLPLGQPQFSVQPVSFPVQ